MRAENSPMVYIVVLNWNGWQDTVDCLESLFRLEYPDYRVVVCDNGSEDNSMEKIRAWAEGKLSHQALVDFHCPEASLEPVGRPIPYMEISLQEVEQKLPLAERTPLILIRNGKNLGFAGGNNVGIRLALADRQTSYVWLLNNDTVVEQGALDRLVERMEGKPEAGVCGSTILFHDRPDTVQAQGGAVYNRVTGSNRHLGLNLKIGQIADAEWIEERMDYVVGASMLVRREFLETIGLMDERYFLYFEELDWATRGKGKFTLAYAPDSIVYHKEGASAGTSSRRGEKSPLSDFFSIRNRLVFTRKFFPWALPSVYAGIVVALLNRLRRGQPRHAEVIWRILLKGAVAELPASIESPET